jgi:hypothetical protein
MISRKEMEELINNKESVVLNGEVIWEISKLPSEAALAKGNKQAEDAARASLKAQANAIKEQLALLDEDKGSEKETKDEEAHKAEETKKADAAKKESEKK